MISEALITQARALAADFTNESCAIQEYGTIDNGDGSFTEGWNTLETVAGLIQFVDDSEQVIGGAPRGAVTHKLRLKVTAVTQAIKPSHRIVVAARGTRPALTFVQPKRMDQSYEVLVTVGAVIDVSNPDQ